MSFPVRILKQWRVHHIHISLCQLGEMRRTIKSPVTDKGNTEVDRIHVQAHICTDTCATSTVAKLDSYKCSMVKQGPANWSVIPSGCKNYRLLLSYFRQSITAQKSTKRMQNRQHTMPMTKAPAKDFLSKWSKPKSVLPKLWGQQLLAGKISLSCESWGLDVRKS